MKNSRIIALLHVDHVVDIITNSSSELFLLKASQAQEVVERMVAEAVKIGYSFEVRYMDGDHYQSSEEWMLQELLEKFPEEARDELREKYFSNPVNYAVIIDRDEDYQANYSPRYALEEMGFVLVYSDY